MAALLQDFRYALRTLRRSWALTLVIVASLAIGIGANTAIFSVVNALMLKPLPYPEPDRLGGALAAVARDQHPAGLAVAGPVHRYQDGESFVRGMSISQGRTGTLLGLEQPERVEALRTSSNLLRLLGAKPLYGRLLLPEDDVPGGPAVIVLSHGFWKRVFGGDPNVVGRMLTLNGMGPGGGETKNQFLVVGVLPSDFMLNAEVMQTVSSTTRMDLYFPLPLGADAVKSRGDENYNLMARLKAGVTMEQAQADVSAIAARIRDKDKRDQTFTISVVSLRRVKWSATSSARSSCSLDRSRWCC